MSFKGGLNLTIGDFEKGIDYFRKALTLFQDIDHKHGIYYQLNNIGWIYRAQGKLDQALHYIQKQMKISLDMGDNKIISWSNYSLGYIYYYQGNLNKAEQYAQESLRIFEELEHETGLSEVYTLSGTPWGTSSHFIRCHNLSLHASHPRKGSTGKISSRTHRRNLRAVNCKVSDCLMKIKI